MEKSEKLLAMEATKVIHPGEEILIYHIVDTVIKKPKGNPLSPSVSSSNDTNDNSVSPAETADLGDGTVMPKLAGRIFPR